MPLTESRTADATTIDVDDFKPPRWLRNRHLSGLWANRVQPAPVVCYRRERWDTPDGDFLDLDWIDGVPGRPIVVGCHGLEGCSQSAYMRRLMAQVGLRGWTAVALNYRKAMIGATGRTVRFLIAVRRPIVVLVVAGLLFSASGAVWTGIVSALLIWLTAERLLGRHAFIDLGKLTRNGVAAPVLPEIGSNGAAAADASAPHDVEKDASVSTNGDVARLLPAVEIPATVPAPPHRRSRRK